MYSLGGFSSAAPPATYIRNARPSAPSSRAPNRRRLPGTRLELGIAFENAAADDAHDADHLLEGVRGRVDEIGIVEALGRSAGRPEPTWTQTGTPSSSALA